MHRRIPGPARTAISAGLLIALLSALSACGAAEPRNDTAITTGASTGATTDQPAPSAGAATQAVVLPEFPIPRVPDLSSLTAAATEIEAAIASEDPVPNGLTVTGARCDTSGTVINRAGANIPEGGQVTSAGGTKQVDPDGSGQVVDGDSIYQVDADGSGQVISGGATLQVDADGSGQAVVAGTTYQVDADGSGQITGPGETYQVDSDGSGQWTWSGGTVTNDGDGAGTWTGPDGVLVVSGDGTGTLDGAPVTVPAMADFAPIGTLPSLQKLRPLGKPCGTLIRIDSSVLFDFDKAEIRPAAQPLLASIAKTLNQVGGKVEVDGYTDAKGSDSYNLDLSERRATAVVAQLTSAGATTPLRSHGYGESRPVARNTIDGKDNPAGRQLNRRVEIVIR